MHSGLEATATLGPEVSFSNEAGTGPRYDPAHELHRSSGGLQVTGHRLPSCPSSPNCVSSQADRPAQRIRPFPLRVDAAARTLPDLRRLIETLPGARVVETEPDYLRAEFSSRILHFVDDVEFLLDPQAQVVQVRSASRTGYWDFGANRRRVEQIRRVYLSPK